MFPSLAEITMECQSTSRLGAESPRCLKWNECDGTLDLHSRDAPEIVSEADSARRLMTVIGIEGPLVK